MRLGRGQDHTARALESMRTKGVNSGYCQGGSLEVEWEVLFLTQEPGEG